MHDFFRLLHVFLKPVNDEWIASRTTFWADLLENSMYMHMSLLVILEREGLCATENVLSLHARLWIVR